MLFLRDVAGFFKSNFKGPKYIIKTIFFPGRVKCGGTEGEIVVAHCCRKRKKLICGPEGEIEGADFW